MVAGCRRVSEEARRRVCDPSTGLGDRGWVIWQLLDRARGSRMGDMATPRPGSGVEDGAFSPALYFSPLSFQPACGGLTLLPLGIARKRSLHSLTRKVHFSPYLRFAASGGRKTPVLWAAAVPRRFRARYALQECSPPPGVAADCRRRGRRGQDCKRKIPCMRSE